MKKILLWILSIFTTVSDKSGNKDSKKKGIGHKHIKGKDGVRKEKVVFACLVWIISFIVVLFIGIVFLDFLYGSLISFVVWITLFTRTLNSFLVSVPEVTGLVTVNLFDGYMESYGTGIHFKYPWEQVKIGNYISLRIVTEKYDEDYPAQDGPLVLVKWSIQYRPTVAGLSRYVAVDESTIHEGFGDLASSYLSHMIASEKAIGARNKVKEYEVGMRELYEKTPAEIRTLRMEQNTSKVDFLKQKIAETDESETKTLDDDKKSLETAERNIRTLKQEIEKYEEEKEEDKKAGRQTKDDCTLEYEYGIDLFIVALSDTNYEPRYQDIRATDKITREADEMIDRMIEKSKADGKQMTREKAYNYVLIFNKSASKDIVETEGEGGNALASLIMGTFRSKSDHSKEITKK